MFIDTWRAPLRVLHEWVTIEYDLPVGVSREELINTGQFIPENNRIANIAVFRSDLFVTVVRGTFGRFPGPEGIPATLNRIVRRNGISLLQPYPDFRSNTVGDCRALQDVVGIEIDRATGWLWVADNGRADKFKLCPPKIVIINTNTRRVIKRHVLSENVLSRERGFIFEIALDIDPMTGFTRYAYLADSIGNTLVVFDSVTHRSWSFSHPSLRPDLMDNMTVGGVNGLAVSPDNRFLYFGPIRGTTVWQIPTFVLRNPDGNFGAFVRKIGNKPSSSPSITFGGESLLFQDNEENSFIEWDRERDICAAGKESAVELRTLRTLIRDDVLLNFTNGLDVQNGFLFYTTFNVPQLRDTNETADFSGRSGPNFSIGKFFLGKRKCIMSPFHF